MKYSKKQLNAISRSYAEKERERLAEIARKYDVMDAFHEQTKYKTLRGYLKSLNLL